MKVDDLLELIVNRISTNAEVRYIAFGSANELEYQLLLSIDLKFIELENGQKLLFQIEEVKKMLNGLIIKLNKADS